MSLRVLEMEESEGLNSLDPFTTNNFFFFVISTLSKICKLMLTVSKEI